MSNVDGKTDHQAHQPRKRRGCLWWIGRILGGLVIFVLVLALAGAVYQAIATFIAERRYPPPGELVDVGGYQLHINCAGGGIPAVVMDSGLPGSSLDWSLVQPEVAKFTRVCAYDRAGYGWSDPGPTPRTSQRIVTELHTLLENAGIEGPYVFVGHSFGGYNVRLYANSFPADVAGIVLVDAAHEDQHSHWPPEVQELEAVQLQMYAFLRAVAPLGLVRLVSELGLDPLLNEFLMKLPADVQPMWEVVTYRTDFLSTAYAELSVFEESAAQVRTTGSLGDMPLVVLTSGTLDSSLVLPGYLVDHVVQIHMELQTDLASLSSNSTHIIAKESGHYIQFDQPELVINAIRQVVDAVRRQ